MNNPYRVAYPSGLPYVEADLLAHLRITGSAPAGLSDISESAIEYIEDYCGITIMETQWKWNLDGFYPRRAATDDFWYTSRPQGSKVRHEAIRIPRPKLKQIDSIQYYDETETQQTLDASKYQVDTVNSRIAPSVAELTWPSTGETLNAVEITFTSGYAAAADVPRSMRLAIFELIAAYYDGERNAFTTFSLERVPHGFEAKLSQFRQWSV